MSYTDSERAQWIERLRDAAIEATCAGVDERDLSDALTTGAAEGRRLLALRAPAPTTDAVPAPRRPSPYPRADAARPAVTAEPGSALAKLLNATR